MHTHSADDEYKAKEEVNRKAGRKKRKLLCGESGIESGTNKA